MSLSAEHSGKIFGDYRVAHLMEQLLIPVAYLTIGALVMLLINELLYGIVTRKEFLAGMLVWPLLAIGFFASLADAYLKRGRIR